ncbi:MEDS domain-containing protein [Nitrosomonas sp. Nm166]|uniref:MEDS domain-containing protein n=1 Tax=Nitrosomonas sp. Nm166 TaxID=1881054 RepID=UPI0008E1582B|nr:MEDS domain-containing protein [Nitrosomonas sp. Nm166]SFF26714.1 MEDS: MEthanogen/methylotroph, DcmR Sensory domain [Nitrosomonas sp. Nm166]
MKTNRTWYLTNPSGSHLVQVCQNESFRAEAIAHYIKEGVLEGEGIIIFAGMALRKNVISKMEWLGLDVATLKNEGQIKFFDAEFLLLSIVVDGIIKRQAFQEVVGTPICDIQLKYGKARVFGEMVNILWKQGQYDTAMQLGSLWNELNRKQEFSLFCVYSVDNLDPNAYEEALERLCKCHPYLTPVKDQDLSGTQARGTVLDAFEVAWNHLISKLAERKKNSAKLPPGQAPLLS